MRTRVVCTSIAAAVLFVGPAYAAGGGDDLQLFPEVGLLLLLIALFSAIVIPIDRILFRPVFKVLEERDAKIGGTREQAERLEVQGREVLERYQKSIREAREDADADRRKTVEAARRQLHADTSAARDEAEGEIQHARRELEDALTSARATLRADATQLAAQAAERVLGRSL